MVCNLIYVKVFNWKSLNRCGLQNPQLYYKMKDEGKSEEVGFDMNGLVIWPAFEVGGGLWKLLVKWLWWLFLWCGNVTLFILHSRIAYTVIVQFWKSACLWRCFICVTMLEITWNVTMFTSPQCRGSGCTLDKLVLPSNGKDFSLSLNAGREAVVPFYTSLHSRQISLVIWCSCSNLNVILMVCH